MKQETKDKKISKILKDLHLPSIRERFSECSDEAEKNGLSYRDYLLDLIEAEHCDRTRRRIDRFLNQSKLPLEKNMSSFDKKRLPLKLRRVADSLIDGAFLNKKENVLAFGKPGSGKTHLLCAVGQELIRNGHRVYFSRCSSIVEDLLKAKRDLKLENMLKKLSKFEALIIDDIGYVKYNQEEMEVLFNLLEQRYERGSVMLTSNLPFSEWDKIFKDPMTTAAVIDRLVHHSVIMELNVDSYRMEAAKKTKKNERRKTEK